MAKVLLLAIALLLAVLTAGCAASVIASNSNANGSCIDRDGDGFVGIQDLFFVIDAYFDQTPVSELCSERPPEPTGTVGQSLENPYPVGSTMVGTDGTETTVTAINSDAWAVIQDTNQFNDPPAPGNRFYMVTLEVANVSGGSPMNVYARDFELIGSQRVVYKTYTHSCGVIPDRLQAEMYPGGEVSGNVCYEVGADETEFVLIHAPDFAVNPEEKRYLRLE